MEIQGVFCVLHTPFLGDGEIDVPTLRAEMEWALQTGANGLVVAMVSETLRLGYRKRLRLAEVVCELAAERAPVIISVGAESIDESKDFAGHAESNGAAGVMAIPPVATSLGSKATLDYYSRIASSISIPLIVQDASSYVGAAIDLGVYLELLKEFGEDRILFKPEASPLGPNVSRLRDATDGKARIFEGSGGINLVDCYRRGITGTMPGTDLLDGIVALWNALRAGDEQRIYQLSFPIGAIASLQLQAGLDGFLAIEKYLMKKRGLFPNTIQLQPVGWELDQETASEIDRLFHILQQTL